MSVSRLSEKIIIRLFLIIIFMPLQSCSNSLIGEKLENSFDIADNQIILENTSNGKKKLNEIKKVKSIKNEDKKTIDNVKENIKKEVLITNKVNSNEKPKKSIKKLIFNPQPYRIILKLSGSNPSAPAETVTKVLRKAGIQFEVEKIERFDDKSFLKNDTLKR